MHRNSMLFSIGMTSITCSHVRLIPFVLLLGSWDGLSARPEQHHKYHRHPHFRGRRLLIVAPDLLDAAVAGEALLLAAALKARGLETHALFLGAGRTQDGAWKALPCAAASPSNTGDGCGGAAAAALAAFRRQGVPCAVAGKLVGADAYNVVVAVSLQLQTPHHRAWVTHQVELTSERFLQRLVWWLPDAASSKAGVWLHTAELLQMAAQVVYGSEAMRGGVERAIAAHNQSLTVTAVHPNFHVIAPAPEQHGSCLESIMSNRGTDASQQADCPNGMWAQQWVDTIAAVFAAPAESDAAALLAKAESRRPPLAEALTPMPDEDQAWVWRQLRDAPHNFFEANAVQLGHSLYVWGGFVYQNTTNNFKVDYLGIIRDIFVFDMATEKWEQLPVPLPAEVPINHNAVASFKDRYIYIVAGQTTGNCGPGTNKAFRFDVQELTWTSLPPLPKVRYQPRAALYDGRLHVAGGTTETRAPPAADHWSLEIDANGGAVGGWREEAPLPEALGGHGSTAVLNLPGVGPAWLVIGGTVDFPIAAPGEPCIWDTTQLGPDRELGRAEVFAWYGGAWHKRARLPLGLTHAEACTLVTPDGSELDMIGGQHRIEWIKAAVSRYDGATDSWATVGWAPGGRHVTGGVCGRHRGRTFLIGGKQHAGMAGGWWVADAWVREAPDGPAGQ